MQREREIPEHVLQALRRVAPEGRITCSRARELAAELEVPVRTIGEACDRLGIKIYACELGCF